MKIILHHCHEARSMRSLWLLNELDIEFDLVLHDFAQLRTKDYLDIHPLGRVPALQMDSEVIYESGAICQYLCEKYSPETLGRNQNHPERAEWLQWLHYSETMAAHGASLVQQNIVLQDEALRSPIIQKIEAKRLQKALEIVEQQLQKNEYLLPSGFSAVDIAVGYSIHLAHYFVSLSDFPNIQNYYDKLSKTASFKQSMPDDNDEMRIFKQET